MHYKIRVTWIIILRLDTHNKGIITCQISIDPVLFLDLRDTTVRHASILRNPTFYTQRIITKATNSFRNYTKATKFLINCLKENYQTYCKFFEKVHVLEGVKIIQENTLFIRCKSNFQHTYVFHSLVLCMFVANKNWWLTKHLTTIERHESDLNLI